MQGGLATEQQAGVTTKQQAELATKWQAGLATQHKPVATWTCNTAATGLATQEQPSGYLDLQHGSNVKNVTEKGRDGEEREGEEREVEGTSSGLGF